jgi:tripartite-type tricarboxylate transporter receptor subunit TctC
MKGHHTRRDIIGGAAAMGLVGAPKAASAQAGSDFYRGKTLRLIVSTTAGGGYDLRGRAMARHFGRFIPGNPTVIVENMPGGGSVVATNYIYNVAAKDGTALCLFQRSIFTTPFLTPGAIKFELSKFNWLGSLGAENGVVGVWHDAPAKTTEDLFKYELITGMPGATVIPTVFNAIIGTKFKVISGYPGNNEIITALERGEVQAIGEWSWTDLKRIRGDWLRDKKILPMLQIGVESAPDLKHVPLAQAFAKSDEDHKVLDIFTSQRQLAFPVVLPPEVSADRVQVLREAFVKMGNDPEFRADMAKIGAETDLMSGADAAAFINRTFANLPPELSARINAFGTVK